MLKLVPAAALVLVIGIPSCPGNRVVVNGPVTPACPSGRYVVTIDNTKEPAEVAQACEKPAEPAPVPNPEPPPPEPAPSPEPPPPDPQPAPTPVPSPSPGPETGYNACPPPVGLKLGFLPNPKALRPAGYRQLANVTPLVRGACRHKGDASPDAVCPVEEACGDHVGSPYQVAYGQPQAYQSGTGFDRDPVDRASDSCVGAAHLPACGYNLQFSTNDPAKWVGGRWTEAGPMRVCVTLPPLATWRCQDGTMSVDGLMDFGPDARSFDLKKEGGASHVPLPSPPPLPAPSPPPGPSAACQAQCDARLASDVAHGHLTYQPATRLYWNKGDRGVEYFDRQCYKTNAAGTRLGPGPVENFGICE